MKDSFLHFGKKGSTIGLLALLTLLYRPTTSKAQSYATFSTTSVISVSEMNLVTVAQQPTATWVVLQTTPTLPGHVIIEQRGYVDKKKNEVVILPGTNSKPMIKGKYKVLITLAGSLSQQTGSYRWEAQFYFTHATGGTGQYTSDQLFTNGGVVVCRLNGSKQGRDRFAPVYLIPSQWKGFVKPAFTFTKDNLKVFSAADISANEPRLRQLLNDSNPFTAIGAARTLTQAGKLDAEFVTGPLAKVRGLRQAVFAYFVVNGATKEGGALERNAQLVPQVAALVKQQSVSGLKNLALGTYAAGVSTAYDPFEPKKRIPLPGFGPALLRAISQRTRELKITKPRSQDERDLLALLQNVGLR